MRAVWASGDGREAELRPVRKFRTSGGIQDSVKQRFPEPHTFRREDSVVQYRDSCGLR
ncbi:MAG: hypothetical protein Q4C47_04445 [Planctomycetia bacterium]|nr:hypothetical protein [Planctomycetia bacterium]